MSLRWGAVASQPVFNDATGGTITTFTSGGKTFRRHTFLSTGTFAISRGVRPFHVSGIASGGGGGSNPGGGFLAQAGGDGGHLVTDHIAPPAAYTVTIGGAGGTGQRGANTTIFEYVITGGAGGQSVQFGIYSGGEPALTGTPASATGEAQGVATSFDRAAVGLASTVGARGAGGYDGGTGSPGQTGAVVIEYEIAP